jgi:hypothetical protein
VADGVCGTHADYGIGRIDTDTDTDPDADVLGLLEFGLFIQFG